MLPVATMTIIMRVVPLITLGPNWLVLEIKGRGDGSRYDGKFLVSMAMHLSSYAPSVMLQFLILFSFREHLWS